MTSKEMKRWLASIGATFSPGKGSHLKVYLNGRRSVLPIACRLFEEKHGTRDQETTRAEMKNTALNLDFPATLRRAKEGGYVVTFRDVPEAITQGEDRADALANAVDALETALECYSDAASDLPRPSKPRTREVLVRPSALACMKFAVYQTMRERGVRKAELARKLGWHLPQINRLLDLHHASRLDQAEAALQVLGKRLEVRAV